MSVVSRARRFIECGLEWVPWLKMLSRLCSDWGGWVAVGVQNEGLGKRLAHGYPNLEAEVAYCARHEYCESVIDFIARRSRLAFLDTDAAGKAIPRVAEILAGELRWDGKRKGKEISDAKAFLDTFKSKDNAHFDGGKHRLLKCGWVWIGGGERGKAHELYVVME